jgi:hypothetical protein
MLVGRRLPVAQALAFRGLLVVVAGGLALVVATSALGGGRKALALDRVSLVTHDVAVPSSAKPKKKPPVCKKGQKSTKSKPCTKPPPVCKKGQKSTKKKPCTKRHLQVADSRANPPIAGWMFGFTLSQNTDSTWGLRVNLAHTAGNASETHSYFFQLAASSVTVAPDLSTLTLDTGAQLAQFGAIKLTFANPSALVQATAPAGCTTGTWQTRSGALTGSVSFVADNSYFKTIVEKSLPADLTANTSGTPATCGAGPVACVHGSSLSASVGQGGPTVYASGGQLAQSGNFSLFEFLSEKVGPATIAHILIEENLPATDLTVASDLSTATATTSGASVFTGSLSFTANAPPVTGPYPACNSTYTVRQGVTTGGIIGHFLAIPTPPPALGPSFASTN